MASPKAKTRSHRRDRRKAKASKWRRQGKTGMGSRIGHGPGPAPEIVSVSRVKKRDMPEAPERESMTWRPFEALKPKDS